MTAHSGLRGPAARREGAQAACASPPRDKAISSACCTVHQTTPTARLRLSCHIDRSSYYDKRTIVFTARRSSSGCTCAGCSARSGRAAACAPPPGRHQRSATTCPWRQTHCIFIASNLRAPGLRCCRRRWRGRPASSSLRTAPRRTTRWPGKARARCAGRGARRRCSRS